MFSKKIIKFFENESLRTFIFILVIFMIGFTLRVNSTNLEGLSDDQKSFYQDDNGLPYMYELDSYYNYRLTKNYLENGYTGDTFIASVEWDSHSYYPPGVPMDYPPLIVYITAFFYKLINILGEIPLLVVCFWLPVFIAPIAGIPAFFLVKKFSNELGGLFAGILIVTTPFYFSRTVPGFFDTDMFNILFPILIVLLLFEAFDDNYKKRIFCTVLAAGSMFLFSMAWNGWQYIFYLLFVFVISTILYNAIQRKSIKNTLQIFIIFFTTSLLLIYLFSGAINVYGLFFGPIELLKLKFFNTSWHPWPNTYISIAELRKPSLNDIVLGLGPVLVGLTILGALLIPIFLRKRKIVTNNKFLLNKKEKLFYSFVFLWIIFGILALQEGARFLMFLITPLVIISSITVAFGFEFFNIQSIREKWIKNIYLILILVLITAMVFNVHSNVSTFIPRAHDDLWNSATWINDNTSNNTVIVSAWDLGHLFTAVADRPVLLDGRSAYIETLPIRGFYKSTHSFRFSNLSPSTARNYWVCRAFCVGDDLSGGIFRMLSSSGDEAWLVLDGYTGNTSKSVEVLNSVLGLDRDEALVVLQGDYGFSLVESERILSFTHPSSPNPFVVVTTDRMLDSGYWNFYYGEWDFNKGVGGNFTYSVGDLFVDKKFVNSSNGFVWDKGNDEVFWNGLEPYCLVVVDDGVVNKRYLNNSSDFCVFMVMDWDKCVVVDKRFENSVFTKLVIERVNTSNFKIKYKNKKVTIWEIKKK